MIQLKIIHIKPHFNIVYISALLPFLVSQSIILRSLPLASILSLIGSGLFSQIQNERCDRLWFGEMIVLLLCQTNYSHAKIDWMFTLFSQPLQLLSVSFDRWFPVEQI